MSFEEKVIKIIERYLSLEQRLIENSSSISPVELIQLNKERADLEPVFEIAIQYRSICKELQFFDEMQKDISIDKEFKELINAEQPILATKSAALLQQLKIMMLPKDIADDKGAILEIRAGTGGEEAALFSSVLFRMYQKYAERHGWNFEVLSLSATGLAGYKEVSASISGKGVFARLKYESGVHRVQRIPETEASGRIHTSAATVAVLPEAEEVDIEIAEKDLKIDVYRSSGAGGQHVNTTDSAVRITHIPTGFVVCQQDEKSQHKNKNKALKILRARLYEAEREKRNAERSAMRKGQVGSGDRSERIRTYNYPQGRVTDHRINLTVYALYEVVNEGALDQFIEALITEDQAKKLAEQV